MILYKCVENKCFSVCLRLPKIMYGKRLFFESEWQSESFILIAVICNHTKKKPKGLDKKYHLEGTHELTLRPHHPGSSPPPSSQWPESAKARETNNQGDEQQEAHIMMASSSKLQGWKCRKK